MLKQRRGRQAMPALIGVTCGSLLSACAVGPDYRPPAMATPDQWHARLAPATAADSAATTALANWWTVLNDATLNQLIEQAVAGNKNVRQALARVAEARARRNISMAGFWPTVDSSTSASRIDAQSRFDRNNTDGIEPDLARDPGLRSFNDTDENYNAALDARWEIDLFGGQRRSFEAAAAQLGATDADLRDVLVTLLGDVALSYVNVRTTQARLDFAERNLASQREVVDITDWRAAAGIANTLDVEQAKASYAQTRAQIPALESSLAAAMNRLAVLTGQPPGGLLEKLEPRQPIPTAPREVIASVPSEVMRRRPDIRGAERRLAAQTAQVGVAAAALYPSLSLTGSFGVTATSAGDLMSNNFGSNRYGLSLSMPIFRAGALRQNVRAQNALVEAALANYEATVLGAYEEVENALVAWMNEQRRHEALVDAERSSRSARELALLQYSSGLVDFQAVLSADRQLIATQDALAVSDGEMTSNLVRLYKALGGGWSVFPPPAGPALDAQ